MRMRMRGGDGRQEKEKRRKDEREQRRIERTNPQYHTATINVQTAIEPARRRNDEARGPRTWLLSERHCTTPGGDIASPEGGYSFFPLRILRKNCLLNVRVRFCTFRRPCRSCEKLTWGSWHMNCESPADSCKSMWTASSLEAPRLDARLCRLPHCRKIPSERYI